MLAEVKRAVREFRRSWQTTGAILVLLALGAGASGTAISVMTTVLTNPMNVRAPDRLVALRGAFPSLSGQLSSAESFLDYKPLLRGLADAAVYSEHDGGVNLVADRQVIRARGAEVTDGFFTTLDIPLQFGRSVREDERRRAHNRVVVLGDDLSRRTFGSGAAPLDRTIRLNDVPFIVIGIAARDLRFPHGAEFWVPVSIGADRIFTGQAVAYSVIGRLSAGTSIRRAQADLAFFVSDAEKQSPGSWPARRKVEIVPLAEEVVGGSRLSLQMLAVALALVWTAAAANIAVMLLARADARAAEMPIRWALGASPRRFLRQFIAEATLLPTASCSLSRCPY